MVLLRLFLALLVASFALPAVAAVPACHEATAMGGMHAPTPARPADTTGPAHVCIGCVPLADWTGVATTAAIMPRSLPPGACVARLDLSGASAPALPPPRIA